MLNIVVFQERVEPEPLSLNLFPQKPISLCAALAPNDVINLVHKDLIEREQKYKCVSICFGMADSLSILHFKHILAAAKFYLEVFTIHNWIPICFCPGVGCVLHAKCIWGNSCRMFNRICRDHK